MVAPVRCRARPSARKTATSAMSSGGTHSPIGSVAVTAAAPPERFAEFDRHLRVDHARRDHVGEDALVGIAPRHGLGRRHDGGLGAGIGDCLGVRRAARRDPAADADHRARFLALEPAAHGVAQEPRWCLQVDLDRLGPDLLPLLDGCCEPARLAHDPCIVDEHVDPPVRRVECLVPEPVNRRRVPEISLQQHRAVRRR